MIESLDITKWTRPNNGITSAVLDWFRSYLCGRVQRVNIDKGLFTPHPLTTGVPQ